jgi:hypothetical protein
MPNVFESTICGLEPLAEKALKPHAGTLHRIQEGAAAVVGDMAARKKHPGSLFLL